MFDKNRLKEALLGSLDHEIDAALAAAQQAQQAASHEDNKPENQYDTLSLEAAYLAHGQSERILKLQQERILLTQWPIVEFTADDVIATGALVLLEQQAHRKIIWITPKGGRTLEYNGVPIAVISPDTPLAKQLSGLSEGDKITLASGSDPCWEIIQLG